MPTEKQIEEFIEARLPHALSIVALLKKYHSGKGHYRNSPDMTLYREIRTLGVPPEGVILMSLVVQDGIDGIRTYKERKAEKKKADDAMYKASARRGEKETVLTDLYRNPKVLDGLISTTRVLFEREVQGVSRALAKEIERDFRADIAKHELEIATGEKQSPLKQVTWDLAALFMRFTGRPHDGVTGQILFRAGLEDVSGILDKERVPVYQTLSNRIKKRRESMAKG